MAPKKKAKPPQDELPPLFDATTLPTPALDSKPLRMTYRIARGEQGVLTFQPYKTHLLPLWRFKTASIATRSSQNLFSAFQFYVTQGDFVGADMCRKFLQMGMTRARRYANHKGGKKYDRSARVVELEGGVRRELERGGEWEGREEKVRAGEVFRGVWERCKGDERYGVLKREFLEELKAWEGEGGREGEGDGEAGVEVEGAEDGKT
ncbi:hypothetical protein B0A50_00403 [Salinomyces thailandicus]|uniref:Uncharacterized protein n=1 Tax=Salinomyces thailandicus TaxID=706561 RepID=A0A4U0UE77_9PEZI|nr:hypothetical protein B0A50_00403 [Salinomyces thailandica]